MSGCSLVTISLELFVFKLRCILSNEVKVTRITSVNIVSFVGYFLYVMHIDKRV